MTTRFADHLLDGTHGSRPAATAVPTGTLYSCSDHSLVYQSDGSTWATWATLSTGGSTLTTTGDILYHTGSGLARLPIGANGEVLTVASGLPSYAAAAGGGSGSVPVKKSYGAGNIALTSTTWVAVDGTGATDIAIAATAGDQIEISASLRVIGPGSGLYQLEVVTVVSGTLTTLVGQNVRTAYSTSAAAQGGMAWTAGPGDRGMGGGFIYAVNAADIVGGQVTLRLMHKSTAGGSVTVVAGSTNPIQWWAKNHGQ